MKLLLQLLALVLNRLPKTDWKPIPLCNVYGSYGLNAPNLVGHASAPTVTTDASPSSITSSSAVFDTNEITNTGGENASVRGICWVVGAGGTPTTANSTSSASGSFGVGTYSTTMSGLVPNTTYSVRAYATNSAGTGYGSTVQVTTTGDANGFVQFKVATNVAGARPIATLDATATAGNLLITTISARWGSTGPVSTFSAPSGWTLIDTIPNMQAHTAAMAYKIATGSETSATWTISGVYQVAINGIYEFAYGNGLELDVWAADGSNTSSVTSIATGATGLSTDTNGVAFLIGLNRLSATTNSLSNNASMNETYDSGVNGGGVGYNEMHAWQNYTSATDYNVTVSSGSSSAMGAMVAVFGNLPPTVTAETETTDDTGTVYYFDGSDTAASGADWTNATNADDGSTSTYAETTVANSGNLVIGGTGAPASGSPIAEVGFRFYGSWNGSTGDMLCEIYSGGDRLGNTAIADAAAGWSDGGAYVELSTPTGGWTWAKVQALEARIATFSISTTYGRVYRVEIKVTTASTTDTTPTLSFTGTDGGKNDIRYNVQISDDSAFGLGTYYFDASDNGPTDDDNAWSDDANAFDGSTSTFADNTSLGGDYPDINVLRGGGTNAPSSGGSITQVRARIYGSSGFGTYTRARIYTDNLAESLGDVAATNLANGTNGWSNYTTLSAPTGGWTWAKVQALEILFYTDNGENAYKAEIEVTSSATTNLDKVSGTDAGFSGSPDNTDPFTSAQQVSFTVQAGDALAADTYYWRVRGIDPSGSNTYGPWSTTRSFEITSSGATLVTQDISHSFTLDTTTITQNHVIVPADISHSLTLDNTTITQTHVLSPADIQHALTLDNTTIAETHILSPNDISHSLTLDNTTITQNHVIATDDIGFITTVDNGTISQNHVVATQDISLTTSIDTTTISQNHVIATQDISHALTLDNTTISQNHVIATQGIQHPLTLDNTTITQNHILATQDISHGLTLDTTTVTEDVVNYTIVTQDISLPTAIDATTITQNHIIASDDIGFITTIDNGTVTETNFNLVTQDISHGFTVDTTTISQTHVLASQDLSHALTADNTTLSQNHVIATDDIGFITQVDNGTISQNHIVVTQDISLALTLDNTTLTQSHILATQGIDHTTSLDTTAISQNHVLATNDISFVLTEDNTTIAQNHVLASQDISLALTTDNTTLDIAGDLAPQDLSLPVAVDTTTITQNHVLATDDIAFITAVDDGSVVQNHNVTAQDISLATSIDSTAISQNHTLASNDLTHGFTLENTTLTQVHIVQTNDLIFALTEDEGTISQIHTLSPADLSFATQLDSTEVSAAPNNYQIESNDLTFGPRARKYYIDSSGNVYWVINQEIGLLEKL